MKPIQPKKSPSHKLRVHIDQTAGEVHVEGNQEGLKYLIAVCSAILGQSPGANHWHLGEAFYTLEAGSPDLIISYLPDKKAGLYR